MWIMCGQFPTVDVVFCKKRSERSKKNLRELYTVVPRYSEPPYSKYSL